MWTLYAYFTMCTFSSPTVTVYQNPVDACSVVVEHSSCGAYALYAQPGFTNIKALPIKCGGKITVELPKP